MVNFMLCNFTSIKKKKLLRTAQRKTDTLLMPEHYVVNCVGPLAGRFFSVNRLENFLDICNNLKDEFSSSLHCKNTVYYTYNIHNTWASIVHVISEASCQQGAVSGHVSGEAEFTGGFPTAG